MIHPSEKEPKKLLSKRSFQQMLKKYLEMFPKTPASKKPVYPKGLGITKELQRCYDKVGMEPIFLGEKVQMLEGE
jgi:hypothetical protein